MANLFSEHNTDDTPGKPLAERMRPKSLNDVLGQDHLTKKGAPFEKFISSGFLPSIIFWGPPGVGKTTLAELLAHHLGSDFLKLSAVESGVKEVRQVIARGAQNQMFGTTTILFIDEIHRFNKSQQDALLGAVERGTLILIGATTENPSFEVIPALLSRCLVYTLKPLQQTHIKQIIEKALTQDEVLKKYKIAGIDWEFLYQVSAGDARRALNAIEAAIASISSPENAITLNRQVMEKALQHRAIHYDKKGETHYDVISAFIKSLRGSDPDAALFWMTKMLAAGEDPKFIARRMVIFASEDVGNAEPDALLMANAVFRAVEIIGLPEAAINLAQGVTYLASCPKSNASYMGLNRAKEEFKNQPTATVPMHLRNAPTKFMKQEGYGKDYLYPHDFEGHFTRQNYFPTELKAKAFYHPTDLGEEKRFKENLKKLWKERYQ